VDDFISTEISNPQKDPDLFCIVTKHMVHDPCGSINPSSSRMKDGICTKHYQRHFLKQTQTRQDGYPLYSRMVIYCKHQFSRIRLIDNSWIVPYCHLLTKIFNARTIVEYCNSVKFIMYVCKYVNKGSELVVFELTSEENDINKIHQYQMRRHISSSEAVWRILYFPIHERHPTVIHLSVHLENSQTAYFKTENAA
ncbi:hypothetical protein AVEN_188805-2-1, partial [Araneus ventricosus]